MEILGIGISELVFIVIIALIVLGPKDMQKAGGTIGKWLRATLTSEWWMTLVKVSREIRKIPAELIRNADEELRQIKQEMNLASDLTSSLPAPPRNPSRSQPIPDSAATKLTRGAGAPPKTEPKETEGGLQNNA